MLSAFQNAFKIPELKNRILFTLVLLAVYRLGGHVPTPGINGGVLAQFVAERQNTLLGFADLFAGGAFSRMTIFALGIMPYISASIIFQLLVAVIPYFEKLSKEGEEGRKKLTQYTRYGTVALTAVQSLGISLWLSNPSNFGGREIVPHPGLGFILLTMITFTTGTCFIMWLGEQITERGIGNGISLIIFAGIVAGMPAALSLLIRNIQLGEMSIFKMIVLAVLLVSVTAAVIVLTQAQRKIPVQYAKQIKGRKVYGGQSTWLPLRVNQAGVIPIIFASSLLLFPATIFQFIHAGGMQRLIELLSPGALLYNILYVVLIVFFTYFYTAITFNPIDVADNLKKYGGFVPGIRPGRPTAEYLDRIMTRITLPGSVALAFVAVIPTMISYGMRVDYLVASFFGGTSLLIVVGVALDTIQQMESHLLMRHYDGFMKKGRIRARRF
ncbi:MAG: preprotein translocase subunit SecY [Candidatus Abyssobacteria bacterium SURF_5]|uniref:Protein translocase subunit SecY n=1 Tax=Abyssobacteria bacterium (strain SURF_5) TaxID=2093360 RepID=A0A3A4NX32_ABYX5|nr:MAG: preprotein translocase subunit SecY [Candidatus Abyssubacteria bacterium SURF_5]